MFYCYVLKSQKDGRHYFGHCQDMTARLKRHNEGKVRSTKSRTPFEVIYKESFETRSEAAKREYFFKTIDGRNWLKSQGVL